MGQERPTIEELAKDAFEELEDAEAKIDTADVAGTMTFVRMYIDALTAERNDASAEAATAHREGFLAGREKSVDDLGYECDRFESLADYEAHLARQRLDREREIRFAESEAKTVGE